MSYTFFHVINTIYLLTTAKIEIKLAKIYQTVKREVESIKFIYA